jgi:hypothetical protein
MTSVYGRTLPSGGTEQQPHGSSGTVAELHCCIASQTNSIGWRASPLFGAWIPGALRLPGLRRLWGTRLRGITEPIRRRPLHGSNGAVDGLRCSAVQAIGSRVLAVFCPLDPGALRLPGLRGYVATPPHRSPRLLTLLFRSPKDPEGGSHGWLPFSD